MLVNSLAGELVTQKEYFRVEHDYINVVVEILKDSDQEYLRLVGFNKQRFKESLKDNSNEWIHELSFENLDFFEDKKINLIDIRAIIKLNLRSYMDAIIEIIDKYCV